MINKQRLLIISDAWEPQVNGVVRTYQNFVHELSHHDVVTRVIGPYEFPLTLPTPGYTEIRLAIRPKRHLYQLINDFKPDILHLATEGPLGWAARDWARDHRFPFTTAYHTHFPAYIAKRLQGLGTYAAQTGERWTTTYLRRFHAPARAVIVSTPTLAQDLKSRGFHNDLRIVSRGVDLGVFGPDGPVADIPSAVQPVALYVGRIATEKNLDDFLKMPWPGTKVVVGDGPLRHNYQHHFPDVHFAGLRTGHELAAYYRAADIFVFPSKTDTFGMVLVEAMACGLPIAAYPVQGPKDIVTAPFLGCLDSDLAVAAKTALQSGDRRARAAHAQQTYRWDQVTQQFWHACQVQGT